MEQKREITFAIVLCCKLQRYDWFAKKKRKKLALALVSIESIMRVIMPYVLIFYNGGKAFLKNAFTSLKKIHIQFKHVDKVCMSVVLDVNENSKRIWPYYVPFFSSFFEDVSIGRGMLRQSSWISSWLNHYFCHSLHSYHLQYSGKECQIQHHIYIY